MINMPAEGSILGTNGYNVLQATATNGVEIVSIDYFANSQVIGTATNPPFWIQWWPEALPQRDVVLQARTTDAGGSIAWSPSVHATLGPTFYLWGGRTLPTGEFLFFYNAIPGGATHALGAVNTLSFFQTYTYLTDVIWSGVYVDEAVRGGAIPERFYAIVPH